MTAPPGRLAPGQRDILDTLPLAGIRRIDVGLEGDWSTSVTTVWRRDGGLVGFEDAVSAHAEHRPSLELYYDGAWVGLHCFARVEGRNVFDEPLARAVIDFVEADIGS